MSMNINTINKGDLPYIEQILYPENRDNIFFISDHGKFTKIAHILGHK